MNPRRLSEAAALAAVVLAGVLILAHNVRGMADVTLLNVSYDPTRELYERLNPSFESADARAEGHTIHIRQSHGGSSRQARAVIAGEEEADVVTLGLPSDVDGLAKRGLVGQDWAAQFPNRAVPYTSTIVFVVRAGNPKAVHDWPDLVREGVEVVTPDPKSSGNGKLSVLAAWGSVVTRGGDAAAAHDYLQALYAHAVGLNPGARGAADTFAVERVGDVHLTWENEAIREVAASNGALQIVYPPVSILAEPSVAVVETNAHRHGLTTEAKAYLAYLFTESAQETIADLGYRPTNLKVRDRHTDRLPPLTLFPVTAIARDWADAQQRFFAENGVLDTLHRPKTQ
ncbi:sulfate ABC transporter substrate-binding protein [Methylobacterium sp. J-030]|uniref:sulfate ABC transporter substrate-binding protein n=1 Tax=Methylobacterium sp. J-030 TaxID=2836627 RepID=UPI001FBBC908|nr:sulfate ABC transporter substrate-binding protein [Methylobacterium sp. J-030]MCJ2068908.1 sulfate ABC transporter substrate-binding protein [Methylobacterium sp. J-030]